MRRCIKCNKGGAGWWDHLCVYCNGQYSHLISPEEELELLDLKKEMGIVGDKNMNRDKKKRYVFLRRKQKSERRQEQNISLHHQSASPSNSLVYFIVGWSIPALIIIAIVWAIIAGPKAFSGGCVISDTNDCLEGGGTGHPL